MRTTIVKRGLGAAGMTATSHDRDGRGAAGVTTTSHDRDGRRRPA